MCAGRGTYATVQHKSTTRMAVVIQTALKLPCMHLLPLMAGLVLNCWNERLCQAENIQ